MIGNDWDEKLKLIHQKIKTYLVQKPGNLDKTNHNYKILKNMINDIEMIQMSILYDYVQKYEGSKYELIDYIIFETNNISLFNDALNRFPFLVNYFDKTYWQFPSFHSNDHILYLLFHEYLN